MEASGASCVVTRSELGFRSELGLVGGWLGKLRTTGIAHQQAVMAAARTADRRHAQARMLLHGSSGSSERAAGSRYLVIDICHRTLCSLIQHVQRAVFWVVC